MVSVDITALAQRLLGATALPRSTAIAVLNGALGDRLADADSGFAIAMTLLQADPWRALGCDPAPHGPRACVMVHGLMGDEHAWAIGTDATRPEIGRAIALAREATTIYVRYNSGRHISTNGRELAERLELAFATWPDLEEITIVAHSMGGLVARSALHYATEAGMAWARRVRRVFLLGVPSHGATLEQLAHVAAFTLETIWNPWTKLIGKAINLRSAGIKDLRHGFVLDEDWRHRDVDQLALRAPRRCLEPGDVQWFIATATLGDSGRALARLLGDGLVGMSSSQGRGFGTPAPGVLPAANVRVFGGVSHMGLMSDPAVLEQILAWWCA